MVTVDVSKQAQAERQGTEDVAYNFDGQDKPSKPPDGSQEVLEIATQAMFANTVVVVV